MNHQQVGRSAEWVAALLGTVCVGRVLAFPFHTWQMNVLAFGGGLLLWSVKLLGRTTAGAIWTKVLTRRPK